MGKRFGGRLKRARMAEGLSQVALSEKIGTNQATVSNWETGKADPGDEDKEKLKKALGDFDRPSAASINGGSGSAGDSGLFGDWLRKARAESKMTVPELAEKAQLSTMSIYNIESGKSTNPQARTRDSLERALKANLPTDVRREVEEAQDIEGLGALTDFDPHDKKSLPTCAGVYVFYDVSDRPIYVGKAGRIATRVKDHSDKFWFKFPIVSHGAYVQIDDEHLRHQVEQVLIKFLKSNAVINKQSVERD